MKKRRWQEGDHNVISDLSGKKLYRSECIKVKENGSLLDGLLVGKDEYAPMNPQTKIRGRTEHIAVQDARPRQELTFLPGQGTDDEKTPIPWKPSGS